MHNRPLSVTFIYTLQKVTQNDINRLYQFVYEFIFIMLGISLKAWLFVFSHFLFIYLFIYFNRLYQFVYEFIFIMLGIIESLVICLFHLFGSNVKKF